MTYRGLTLIGQLLLLAVLPLRLNAQTWNTLGGGVSGEDYETWVYALALDASGNLYAGGEFDTAGGAPASNIAKWNGTTWEALGGGVQKSDVAGEVNSMVFDHQGNLYVGGDFIVAGHVPARNIAKWDGTNWSPLGNGMYSRTQALAVDAEGNLYASEETRPSVGGAPNMWNGTTWIPLDDGAPRGAGIEDLAVDGAGNLFVANEFHTLSKWDGADWSHLPVPDGAYYLFELVIDKDDNIYAAGTFEGGAAVVKWDGQQWSTLGDRLITSQLEELAIDAEGNIYVAARFTPEGFRIKKWDGTSWSIFEENIGGGTYAMVFDDAGDLYVGGYFGTVGPQMIPAGKVAKRNQVTVGAEDEQHTAHKLSVFPNPSTGDAVHIRLTLPAAQAVRISLYDVLGREVAVPVNESRGPGIHEIVFEAAHLSDGMYLCRLQAGSHIETEKLVLVRMR